MSKNKVICDHAKSCGSITCGHRRPHEFHVEVCEIDHDGKPITCAAIDKVVKCVVDSVSQRLEMGMRAIDILRGLTRRTVCPMCFHLKIAGHSDKCEITNLLDDYDDLG